MIGKIILGVSGVVAIAGATYAVAKKYDKLNSVIKPIDEFVGNVVKETKDRLQPKPEVKGEPVTIDGNTGKPVK